MRDTFPLKVIINSINNIYFEIKQSKRKALYNRSDNRSDTTDLIYIYKNKVTFGVKHVKCVM